MPLLHFLNPVPIQLIHDRWVSKYTRPRATALLDLKAALERKRENMNKATATKPQQVYQVYIKATPEQVWEGITNPAFTSLYFYGTHVKSTLKEGTPFNYYGDDPTSPTIEGKVLESDPPRRLVHTWRMLYNRELAADAPSRMTWEIEPLEGGVSKLTAIHDQFDGETATFKEVAGGWSLVLSGLKTLLETGKPLQAG